MVERICIPVFYSLPVCPWAQDWWLLCWRTHPTLAFRISLPSDYDGSQCGAGTKGSGCWTVGLLGHMAFLERKWEFRQTSTVSANLVESFTQRYKGRFRMKQQQGYWWENISPSKLKWGQSERISERIVPAQKNLYLSPYLRVPIVEVYFHSLKLPHKSFRGAKSGLENGIKLVLWQELGGTSDLDIKTVHSHYHWWQVSLLLHPFSLLRVWTSSLNTVAKNYFSKNCVGLNCNISLFSSKSHMPHIKVPG